MCCRWQWSCYTWSQQTSEYLWIWSQSRIKACLHSSCHHSLYRTWDRSSCYPLNQPGYWDEGPQSSPSMPNPVLYEWFIDWWSPQVFGTHTQWDHACHPVRNPIWCHPPIGNFFKVEWSNFSLWNENTHLRRVWWPEYPQNRTHGGSSTMGSVHPWL